MAAVIEEAPSECLCEDYSDHNISNNGQHAYRHCRERRCLVQHDKLFVEQEVATFGVHDRQLQNKIEKDEVCLPLNIHNEDIKADDANSIDKANNDAFDDIEIIIYLEKGSEEIRVDVVSKIFKPEKNQIILGATFEIPDNVKFSNKNDFDEKTKLEKHKRSKEIKNAKDAKHVHFQEQTTPKHTPCLRSHKMEKDHDNHVARENQVKLGQKDNCKEDGHAHKSKSVSKIDKDTTCSAMPHKQTVSKSDLKSGVNAQRTTSRVSSSECDLRNRAERNIGVPNNVSEKKIILLRRGFENGTIPEQTKINKSEADDKRKDRNPSSINDTTETHQKQSYRDVNKLNNTVQISRSNINTTTSSAGGDVGDTRRSKSTINTDDTKKTTDRKERERQKKKLKSKKKRQYKNKVPRTEKEIFQRQIENGQLRSMFSRYKTEGLRFLNLQELLHKGTFSTKYKAAFQNKQVVLTIYREENADDINALEMAHMGNSYFVLGFTDCMMGPYGSIWFMSMYHGFGDLQQLLSRDPNRHVIGERQAQFITAGVLIGVDFLHQHEIVHGNIKPSKVLINALGYPVLTGFVKMRDNPDREGNQAYTPAYVAPEHLRGNRSEAIDIFSVGCMAYEIITGWTPFDGETREQTLLNIQKTHRPLYDPELFSFAGEFFIDICLRKSPKERFYIGEERGNLVFEEWFSTLNWRDFRRQTLRSPVLEALKKIENRATLTWEEKTVQFKWGQVMDVMCPYTPSLEFGEDIANFFYVL